MCAIALVICCLGCVPDYFYLLCLSAGCLNGGEVETRILCVSVVQVHLFLILCVLTYCSCMHLHWKVTKFCESVFTDMLILCFFVSAVHEFKPMIIHGNLTLSNILCESSTDHHHTYKPRSSMPLPYFVKNPRRASNTIYNHPAHREPVAIHLIFTASNFL